ncbi:MAG: leucine-rich repeat domain-containing protein [Oscillospiraceae bacterium]|nr:leucine-rich repeat domain-containing protein [Oscillospiraceae bacterium]
MGFSYGFFNAKNLDRVYTAEDFTSYLSSLICNGILDTYGQCFSVTANGNLSVSIGTGKAWINGHYFINDTKYTLDLSQYVDESLTRFVVIGISCDVSDAVRMCKLEGKAGTAATAPSVPTLENTDTKTYLTLAVVRLDGGITEITKQHITDCREDSSVCGYCKCILGKCKVSEILSSLSQYTAKVAELTKKLSDQQTQIADMQAKLEDFTSDMVTAGQCGEDVYYIQYADGSLLLRGTGATYDYELNGNISIFKGNTDITKVTIGSGITRIGNYLFYKCYNMASITLSSTLTQIGSHSMAQYDDYAEVVHGLWTLTIPPTVKKMDDYAFSHNAMTELIVPSSVSTMGDYVFSDCAALKTVRVESGVIGSYMFTHCAALNSLTISENCKSIGENVLSYCKKLTTITYEGSLEQWAAITKPANWIQTGDHQHNGYLQKIQCLDGYLEYNFENNE